MSTPTRITIYNHKGGVGKTTLTLNIAAALAELGKRVLLVDTDPQCNLTSYLLSDSEVNTLLDQSETSDGATIWTALKPVLDSVGPVMPVHPVQVNDLFLLPGDIRLSEFEEFLGESWATAFRRRLGALQAICSIRELVDQAATDRDYDFVFYDTGPNIGPLNRVLLLDSDYFIVPVACDLFSVRALSTLGQTIKRWILDAGTIAEIAPDDAPLLGAHPRFLGYIPQRFKVYGQQMALAPTRYLRQIRARIYADVSAVLRLIDEDLAPSSSVDPQVGNVKDYSSLVQAAQRSGVAIWNSKGQSRSQRQEARNAFVQIAEHLVAHT